MTDTPTPTPDEPNPTPDGAERSEGEATEPTPPGSGEADTTADTAVSDAPTADAPKSKSAPADQRKLLLAVGVLVFVAVVAIGVGIARKNSEKSADSAANNASASTSSTAGTGCLPGTWPTLYMGQPKNLSKGTDSGYYLWNDGAGWHLRTIDPSGTSFKGTITSTVKIDPKRVKSVPDNAVTVTVDANTLTFQMTGSGTATGIDFQVGCAAESFSAALATAEGLPYPSSGIFVGKEGHPLTNPIVVVRK